MRDALHKLIKRYPDLKTLVPKIEQTIDLIIACYKKGGRVLLAGNGGSACDCEHIAAELLKSFILPRPLNQNIKNAILNKDIENGEYIASNLEMPLSAIALTSHFALSSAFSNDKAPDLVFAQQLLSFGNSGDVFIGISTSGNSKNVVYAAILANAIDIDVVSFTGESGGMLLQHSLVNINVPSTETYRIQEYHLPIYHAICIEIEKYFFGGSSSNLP